MDNRGLTWPVDYFNVTADKLINVFDVTLTKFEVGKETAEATIPAGKPNITLQDVFLENSIDDRSSARRR